MCRSSAFCPLWLRRARGNQLLPRISAFPGVQSQFLQTCGAFREYFSYLMRRLFVICLTRRIHGNPWKRFLYAYIACPCIFFVLHRCIFAPSPQPFCSRASFQASGGAALTRPECPLRVAASMAPIKDGTGRLTSTRTWRRTACASGRCISK